jgi:pimeloyl-ACP methyl ester carboxylesterase
MSLATVGLEAWFAGGERVPVTLRDGRAYEVFCRVEGGGAWVTLVHGFPTCSWDWAAVAEGLAGAHRLLLPDLLGFGDSDKPPGHGYSLVEQADAIEALWQHFGVLETALVAHDIGGSVAQELLARQSAGRLNARLTQVVILNSALYEGISRPRPVQKLLANGLAGPLVARLMTQRLFTRNLAAVFSAAHPLAPETANQYWHAFTRRTSEPHIHRLVQYIPERTKHHTRWEQALEHTTVPLHFIWGLQDPVSGVAVADVIRTRLPNASLLTLDDVGHYPQLEAPERVGPALLEVLRAPA